MKTSRPYATCWTYRFGFTVIVFGYGVTVGLLREGERYDHGERNWMPIQFFRNAAVRGLIHG